MNQTPPEQPADVPDDAASVATDLGGRLVEVAGRGQVNLRDGVPAEAPSAVGRRRRGGTGRRQARVLAFQVLYEMDVAHHAPGGVLQRFLDGDTDQPFDLDNAEYVHGSVASETVEYARDLISGVLRHREEIDRVIQERAPAWPLRQMSVVDRTILRLGLYECCHQHGMVPIKVAINEAIELAKLFGSESLPRFVNGVLGSVVASQDSTTG
jgi:transcription antitermination protein NusB